MFVVYAFSRLTPAFTLGVLCIAEVQIAALIPQPLRFAVAAAEPIGGGAHRLGAV